MRFPSQRLVMVGALLLAGCGSIDRDVRIAQRAEQWKTFSAADQKRLKAGKVQVGDSVEAVLIALGEPSKKLMDPRRNLLIWRYDLADGGMIVGTGSSGIPRNEEESTVISGYYDAASLQQQAELKQSDADHRRALSDIHDQSYVSRPVGKQAVSLPTYVVLKNDVVVMLR